MKKNIERNQFDKIPLKLLISYLADKLPCGELQGKEDDYGERREKRREKGKGAVRWGSCQMQMTSLWGGLQFIFSIQSTPPLLHCPCVWQLELSVWTGGQKTGSVFHYTILHQECIFRIQPVHWPPLSCSWGVVHRSPIISQTTCQTGPTSND